MSNDDPLDSLNISEFIINMTRVVKLGIEESIRTETLTPVDHGYCWYCSKEKSVLEVTSKNAPTQPPICEACFIKKAITIYSDINNLRNLVNGF